MQLLKGPCISFLCRAGDSEIALRSGRHARSHVDSTNHPWNEKENHLCKAPFLVSMFVLWDNDFNDPHIQSSCQLHSSKPWLARAGHRSLQGSSPLSAFWSSLHFMGTIGVWGLSGDLQRNSCWRPPVAATMFLGGRAYLVWDSILWFHPPPPQW